MLLCVCTWKGLTDISSPTEDKWEISLVLSKRCKGELMPLNKSWASAPNPGTQRGLHLCWAVNWKMQLHLEFSLLFREKRNSASLDAGCFALTWCTAAQSCAEHRVSASEHLGASAGAHALRTCSCREEMLCTASHSWIWQGFVPRSLVWLATHGLAAVENTSCMWT